MSESNLPALIEKATQVLEASELAEMNKYIEGGGRQLAIETSAKFFELFLNGDTVEDIARINKAFPRASINWCRVKYDWDGKKFQYFEELTEKIKEKAIRAQLETTGLISDLLVAATKKHGDAIRRFLITGDESSLPKDMNIDSVTNILRLAEGLQKITGQTNTINVKSKTEHTSHVDGTINVKMEGAPLTDESSAQILAILVDAKKKSLAKK